MENKRVFKLMTTLTALVIVLLAQTQYIKSEEKTKPNLNNQNIITEINDKAEKDINKIDEIEIVVESKEEIIQKESEKAKETASNTDIDQNDASLIIEVPKPQLKAEEKPEVKLEVKPEVKPMIKPEPVITIKDIEHIIAIDFQIENKNDANLFTGETKVEVNGVKGKRKIVSQEKYSDGKLISTSEVTNEVILNPINQILLQGSKVPEANISSEQAKAMFSAMNLSRQEAGKAPLTWSNDLANAAGIRSKEISESFSHIRPNGQNFNTVNPSIVFGENIASASSNAQETHILFMNSAGHRDNILDSEFKSVGISTYKIPSKPGATYWTVLFNY